MQMEMLRQPWRLEFERGGINSGNLCLSLPIRTCLVLREGSYTEIVCKVVCNESWSLRRTDKTALLKAAIRMMHGVNVTDMYYRLVIEDIITVVK